MMPGFRRLLSAFVDRRVLFPAIVVGGLASLFIGVQPLTPAHLIAGDSDAWRLVVLSRLPRLAAVLLSGAALSVTGVVLQILLQNRFASPGTVATTDGAQLGFLVGALVFPSAPPLVRLLTATVFALLATGTFLVIIRRLSLRSAAVLPLVGIVFGRVLSAVAEAVAFQFEMVQSVSSWLTGDFSMVVRGQYELLYVGVPLAVLVYALARHITIAGLGRETATGLGLEVRGVTTIATLAAATMTAVVVVVGGTLPFVGLVVPNLVAAVKGDNLNRTMPEVALFGAAFVLVADVVGRIVIHPYEIPIGLTIGVLGSVVFLVYFFRSETGAT